MNRDKDEFWAITDPDGVIIPGTFYTRVDAIDRLSGGAVMRKGRAMLSPLGKEDWQRLYRQGYRARRVRVEVI